IGAPAPRLFGGIAFRPEAARPAPWSDFGDASFAMPRWLYMTSGDRPRRGFGGEAPIAARAFLRLAVRPGQRLDPAEIERTEAAIRAAAEGNPGRGSAPSRAASGA